MEHLSYKGGCGIHEHTHIDVFKRRAGLGYNKQLRLIINTMLSSTSDLQPSTAIANQLPGH